MKTKKQTPTIQSTPTTSMMELAQLGQEGIPAMLEMVKKKIAVLVKESPVEETTKGKVLPGFTEIAHIDKVSTLVKAHSSVVGKARAYETSAKALNVDIVKFPFKLEDCTEKQWISDIEARVSILVNKKEIDKLKATQKILEENLSQEAKLRNDLEKVASMFSDEAPLE